MAELLPPPSVLALCSAVLFGGTVIFAKLGMAHVEPFQASWLSIGATMALFWVVSPFVLEGEAFLSPWVLWFALLGILQPFLSVSSSFKGTQLLGPTISSTVASTAPLFSVTLAALILHERLSAPVVAGTLGIVAGVAVLSWSGRARRDWAMTALLFPLGTAVIRGFSHMGSKYGLDMHPYPVLAGLLGYTVAFLAGIVLRGRNPARLFEGLRWAGLKWLVLAGIGNGISILSLLTAFKNGEVVVVSPIVATFPMFTLVFSVLFFRQERITRRTVAGALLIVPSVMAIGLFR